MAMRLGRNLGKYAAAGAPFSGGFGASFARGPRGGAAVTPRLPACHFFSGSQSSIKRKLQDILAEFKDSSPKEYFTLTVGTTILACVVFTTVWKLPSDISRIKNFTKSKLGNMRDGGDSSRDGGGSSRNGV